MPTDRKLRVFLCHASQDKPVVRELYQRLLAEDWIDLSLDGESPESVTEWEDRIDNIIRDMDVILLCLSTRSHSRDIFRQPGFVDLWRRAKERSGKKFQIIPIRLDDFVPDSILQMWRWLDYFADYGADKLVASLRNVAQSLGILTFSTHRKNDIFPDIDITKESHLIRIQNQRPGFIKLSMPSDRYFYWIARQPVTCVQFDQFLRSSDYSDPVYWRDFSKYDANCKYIGEWDHQELEIVDAYRNGDTSKQEPCHWVDTNLVLARPMDYVKCISWYEANAFCKWLTVHWCEVSKFSYFPGLDDLTGSYQFRLPLRTEWIHAVKTGRTLPPDRYPDRITPPGVMFVPDSMKEWFLNLRRNDSTIFDRYYGIMFVDEYIAELARIGYDSCTYPFDTSDDNCFRLVAVAPNW